MWLCTQLGFFSIVRKSPDEFHIRARCCEDLATLASTIALPEPVESYPGSDYPWRILCDPADLTRLFALMSASITYGNFKSAIASHPTQYNKLDVYHDIHHQMVVWQQEHTEILKNNTL
jgi:hypothetical protein